MVDDGEPSVLDLKDDENADQTGPSQEYHMHLLQYKFLQVLFNTSTRSYSWRPVLGQKRTNIRICVSIRKDNDNRYAQFKAAQKVRHNDVMAKERELTSSIDNSKILNTEVLDNLDYAMALECELQL